MESLVGSRHFRLVADSRDYLEVTYEVDEEFLKRNLIDSLFYLSIPEKKKPTPITLVKRLSTGLLTEYFLINSLADHGSKILKMHRIFSASLKISVDMSLTNIYVTCKSIF